jgi:hypothetical protein
MEILLIALGIAALVAAYFCLGIALKFIWGWWLLVVGIPILLTIGLAIGWVGALVAIIGFFVLLEANNQWHGSELYLAIERRIDGAFHLSDT